MIQISKYQFDYKTFKTNFNKPQPTTWWLLICVAFFLVGTMTTGHYYQDRCNAFVIETFLDPAAEFRQQNPALINYDNINLSHLFQNETSLSPLKQLNPLK